jgi:hypothetical protein
MVCFFNGSLCDWGERNLNVVLFYISLTDKDVEQFFFMHLLTTCTSLENCPNNVPIY